MRRDEVREYYDRLTAVDIGAVARDLMPGRITTQTATELQVDCPHHPSASRASLRVSLHEGLWTCFGCGVGGDVLQLVEFVQFKVVTAGRTSPMPDTHRAARDWLAQREGMPTLAEAAGLDSGRHEAARASAAAVFDALTAVAEVHNAALLADAEMLAWVASQWGFSEEVVKRFKIGLGAAPGEVARLVELGHTDEALVACGAFSHGRDGLTPFFRGRITFPYFDRGRVVYMIGRRCPRTPDGNFERAKYKKLPVNDETLHPKVSPLIDNGKLWGEGILLVKPPVVLFTEGVADAVAAQAIGFPTVSPVTIRVKRESIPGTARRLGVAARVVAIQDNEWSAIGELAAVRTAMMFRAAGVNFDVAALPLGEKQRRARAELADMIGEKVAAEAAAAPPEQRKKVALRQFEGNENALAKVEALIDASKIDLAEWIRDGGDAEALAKIVAGAAHPAVFAARSVDVSDTAPEDVKVRAARDVLELVAESKPAEQEQALRALKDRLGLALDLLRRELRETKKEQKEAPGGGSKSAPTPTQDDGTCAAVVERVIASFRSDGKSPKWEHVGEAMWRWFNERGARFFRTTQGEPCVFWRDQVYRIAAQDAGAKNAFNAMIYREARIVPATTGVKTALMVLAALATSHGEVCDEFAWVHTRLDEHDPAIFMATGNERHEIVRVTPDGVSVLPNGINRDKVILRCDHAFGGFDFDPDASVEDLDADLDRLVGQHMACSDVERRILLDWICCFPLLEFAGTRPMVRLEGSSGSGKTMGAKLLTTLTFGSKREKKATDAANYSDASRNPLVALDNVETENVTQQLLDFLLTSVTGIVKQKRASGSDTGLVEERPMCLILSTGVEPLGGTLEEILTRSIVVEFQTKRQNPGHVEEAILGRLRAARPRLLSAILKRCSMVLALMRGEGHARAMAAIRERMGDAHPKRRCEDFLALMYLHRVAAAPAAEREGMLRRLDSDFVAAIEAMNDATESTSRESSPIGLALDALFKSFRAKDEGARESGLNVDGMFTITGATARDLFQALCKVAKDRAVPFRFKDPSQFAKRFSAAIETLRQSGFRIEVGASRNRSRTYTLRAPEREPVHDGQQELPMHPDDQAEELDRTFGRNWNG